MEKRNSKIIVILGPTSSGKSDMAIRLARKFNGEIISADSRQIYRGMDIGTGKIHGIYDIKHKTFISEGIAHHMIDIIRPKTRFSAAQFKKKADKIIADILKRGKLPIICGGTGFWIKSLVDDVTYPEVKPDWKLHKKLNNKSAEELFNMLQKLDSERAKTIDKNNKVRLIRSIEICKKLGKVPAPLCHCEGAQRPRQSRDCFTSFAMTSNYQFLQIGMKLDKEKLHENIKKRLKKRFETGMIEEVIKLHKRGLSWKKIQSFGLGYFWIPKYLHPIKYAAKRRPPKAEFNRVKTKEELFEKIYQAEKDYAKRQMTWFQKDKRIKWIDKYKDIEKEVTYFLK